MSSRGNVTAAAIGGNYNTEGQIKTLPNKPIFRPTGKSSRYRLQLRQNRQSHTAFGPIHVVQPVSKGTQGIVMPRW